MTTNTTWEPTAEQRELLLDVAKNLDKMAKQLRRIMARMRENDAKVN